MFDVDGGVISMRRILIACVMLGAGDIAVAQLRKPNATSRLAIDVVSLRSGKSVRGALLHAEPGGALTLAVSREWFKQANPELFAKAAQDEASGQRAAWEQLRERLTRQLDSPPDSPRLVFFLETELRRTEKLLENPELPEAPQFVWFDAPRKTVSKVTAASIDGRRIALWAWGEGLTHVETRDVNDLTRELKQKGIDPEQSPPDLSDRLAARVQDDREWSARLAFVAYALGEPFDFQGNGDVLVRAGGSRELKDLAPVIAQVLKGQVDTLLKELIGDGGTAAANGVSPDDWLKPARSEADQAKVRAFRATRVDLSVDRRQAVVQSVLQVRFEEGKWETIWSDRQVQDAATPRADLERQITQDPQVKSALDVVKSLGLGADDQIVKAIRFGAATMEAQRAVDSRFFEFRDRLLQRLDGPPLWWK